jgi:hypothetical protein
MDAIRAEHFAAASPAPTTDIPSAALAGVVRAVTAWVLLLSLILHALLMHHRSRPQIKGSSVPYCHAMATGPLLISIAVMLIPELTNEISGGGVCAALPVLFSMGFNLIFGSAFLRSYRTTRSTPSAACKCSD